jgi:ABC-2 type transport system permease protein
MIAFARAVWVMYRRAIAEFVALGPSIIIVPLVVPLFMLVVYPRVFASVMEQLHVTLAGTPGFEVHTDYLQYVAPAAVVMAGLLASGTAGIGTAVERQLGFYDRMELSPFGPSVSEAGRRLADASRIALFVVVLSVVAWIDGDPITNWVLGLAVPILLVPGLSVAYGGIAFALCLRTGSAEGTQAVTPLFFPALFMSTAFLPRPLLPSWLQGIARYNPISGITDATRAAYVGRFDGNGVRIGLIGIACTGMLTQVLVTLARRRVSAR